MLHRLPVVCESCGMRIEPGEVALCNDGYARIYGEYVLGEIDDLHEDNWPYVHQTCTSST